MSYSKSNNINLNLKAIVKYCKVCHDAGKSEAEYRSHFIRESPAPTSKVVCPTLLAQECRYCFNSGHTIKYCPTLKKHEKSELTNTYITQTNGKAAISFKKTLTSKSNLFECLNHDSSDEEEAVITESKKVTESKTALKATEFSYASALKKIAVTKPKAIVVAPAIKVVIPYKMSSISWADAEDSEPEDSDDEEFNTCPSSSR